MISKTACLAKAESFEIPDERMVPNDEQILVKLKLLGLRNWELNHHNGTLEEYRKEYSMEPRHGWIGQVVKVGKNVKGFEPGDVVTGYWQGIFSEYCLTTPRCCFKVSSGMNSKEKRNNESV